MPKNTERKYTQVIDYVEEQIGSDINRDLMKVAIGAQDVSTLTVDVPKGTNIDTALNTISGQVQSAVDVADKIDQLEDALASVGSDELLVALNNNNAGTLPVEQQTPIKIEANDDSGNTAQLQAEEIGTALGGTETALVTYIAQALSAVGNDQLRVDLQNSNATNVNTLLNDRSARTSQLSSSADISSGVSQTLRNNDSFTLYLSTAGSIDVTVNLSPDGGTTTYEASESPVQFASSGDETVKFSYDSDWIELVGSNSTSVTAQVREVI